MKGLKILVVDDESLMRQMLDDILTQQGCEVDLAAGAREAMDFVEKKKFDVMLSDVKMPQISGFDLLKDAKSRFPDMGVVIMTAYSDAFTMKEAFLLGADEYITKPFNIQDISLIIGRVHQRVLSRKQKRAEDES